MTIRSRLTVVALIPVLLALIAAAAVYWTNKETAVSRARDRAINGIRSNVLELNLATDQYLRRPEKRPRMQFESAHESLKNMVAFAGVQPGQEESLINRMRESNEATGKLFALLVSLTEKREHGAEDKDSTELRERITGQLLTISRDIITDALALSNMSAARLDAVQNRGLHFILLTILFAVAAIVTLSYLAIRSVLNPINKLQEGAKAIAHGNLGHRVEIEDRDEIGHLAKAFNAMTKTLGESYVSIEQLQGEITQRKRAETTLRESEQRWAITLASIGDAVIATDVEGKIAFMNAVAEELTGWAFGEASTRPVTEVFIIINEHSRNAVESPVAKVLRKGMVIGLANHTILVRKDGTEIPIDDSGAPINDKDGNTMGVVLVFRDITERKQAEEMTAHLASYPQLNPSPVIEVGVSGEITFSNSSSRVILEKLGLDKGDSKALLPRDMDAILRDWDKKSESTLDRQVFLADRVFGETIHLVPQFNVARVYAHDITERKLQENRIARLSRLYAVLSQVNEAIVRTHDEESLFSGVCRTVAEVGNFPLVWIGLVEGQQVLPVASCGQEADYLKEIKVEVEGELGRGPTGTSIRENRPVINDDFATNPSTLPWHEAALRRGFHSSAAFPLRRHGRAVGSFTLYAPEPGVFDTEQIGLLESLSADVSYALDVIEMERLRVQTDQALRKAHEELEKRVQERTEELQQAYDRLKEETGERERVETQLRQAQKMEALGTMSGGIAHDFNNMLAAIIGFTELVAGHVAKGSRDARHLDRIMEAGIRGRELVRQMLTFSRKTEQEKKPLPVGSIVKETVKLVRATTPATISIRVSALSESALILGDPTQIQQVLMNLCTNATYAMREKGGILDIELNELSVKPSNGDPRGIRPGLYMKLAVRDTGIGMSPDIVDKIFDPFFTTKKVGEGTGLGLSVVHGIVKQHEGYITVESEPNKGSTFTVYFPKVSGALETDSVSDDELPTGSERILFVDDEEALVEMGEDILAELGYEVTSRSSSMEALALFKADPSRFDLVITDQTMPDITGADLAEAILALRADMPIIMCTGFSHMVDTDKAKAIGIRAFAMKPLTKREIARTIRKALDE